MWEQGEHVALVGDTGTGKTYLLARLLQLRDWNIVFKTKADDIRFPNFRRIRRTDQISVLPRETEKHYVLEPSYARQAEEGERVIERVWQEGGWTFTIDELWFAENKLRLSQPIDQLLTQGRSLGITVVSGMQRPSRVSRFALSQCTHLFAFRTEGRDTLTLAEAFTPRLKEVIPDLHRFEFIYYNRASRELQRGYAQNIGAILEGVPA